MTRVAKVLRSFNHFFETYKIQLLMVLVLMSVVYLGKVELYRNTYRAPVTTETNQPNKLLEAPNQNQENDVRQWDAKDDVKQWDAVISGNRDSKKEETDYQDQNWWSAKFDKNDYDFRDTQGARHGKKTKDEFLRMPLHIDTKTINMADYDIVHDDQKVIDVNVEGRNEMELDKMKEEVPKTKENVQKELHKGVEKKSQSNGDEHFHCQAVHRPNLNMTFWNNANPHPYNYLLSDDQLCRNKDVMFLILSAPGNFKQRQLTRDTWASVQEFSGVRLGYAFLLGYAGLEMQDKIREEFFKYRDIIQEYFTDAYDNLPVKTIMGLKYAWRFCGRVKLVYKVDDDTLVNVYKFVEAVWPHLPLSNGKLLCGDLAFLPKRLIPFRKRKNPKYFKFVLTMEEYPEKCFPVYCSGGGGFGMSPEFAKTLYQKSLHTRPLRFEDVYITGILPALLQGTISKFNVGMYGLFEKAPFDRDSIVNKTFICIHTDSKVPYEHFKQAWSFIQLENSKVSKKRTQ